MITETISSLAAGTVVGLSAGFAPGPLLTLVITQTLRHNIREGIKVSMAPLITDLPIIVASLVVLSKLSDFDRLLGAISLAGGFYILYLAQESIRTGPVNLDTGHKEPRSFRKGALINALNPHPYVFWTTVGGPFVLKSRQESLPAAISFVAGFYVCLVGAKVFLALLVGRSETFLTKKGYIRTMRVLGCLLAAFAVFLLKDALFFLGILPR